MHALLPNNAKPISVLHGQLILVLRKQTAISYQQSAETEFPADSREPRAESPAQAYLTLYHPAAALYNGSMRQTLLDDFAKIPGYMDKIIG